MPKQTNIVKHFKNNKPKDWHLLEFYVPIEETFSDGDDFMIKGVAINETTTLNNVKYVAEELQKAAQTFRNVPILLDHRNEIGSIVGRTTENVTFNSGAHRIDYEAKIMDSKIKEMIKDGRIQNVSIGAKVEDLLEEEDGSMKAIGIKGLEISLVAVPGDNQASLAQAIQHSFKLKEMAELDKFDKLNHKGGKIMTEETEKEEVITEPAKEAVEAPKEDAEAPAEEAEAEEAPAEAAEKAQATIVNVNTDVSEMRTQLNELKEMIMAKKVKEDAEDVAEPKAEAEVADETVGEVTEEEEVAEEKAVGMIVERSKGGYSMYKDYTKEGADSKLKRLIL